MTPEQVIQAIERILEAPTPAEKRQRMELVGAWERRNHVWGGLGVEPPVLPYIDIFDLVPKKRKADTFLAGSSKHPSKKTTRKPKNLSAAVSRPDSLEERASSEGLAAEIETSVLDATGDADLEGDMVVEEVSSHRPAQPGARWLGKNRPSSGACRGRQGTI
ncbi:hypothetical protein GUJ93_ZPchr0014g46852 [Zizania palustris]|uniref:Uncharacterized protein n=1 Tax=Zizania palustris TaxID=103762 RepID=A0A8J5VUM2_ZIZPA|nr:hypothetical protein GUJ93_ZPchr0014g46852 [Zizania palustris]